MTTGALTSPRQKDPGLELLGGVDLSVGRLRGQLEQEPSLSPLIEMLDIAEYWLSFDLASFEPMLTGCPSPLKEIGVAALLRFGERPDGRLSPDALAATRRALGKLKAPYADGLDAGLQSLNRAVAARERFDELLEDGYVVAEAGTTLSAHALRAMGHADIEVVGHDNKGLVEVQVGEPFETRASDRSKILTPPVVESLVQMPVLIRDQDDTQKTRAAVVLVPGRYILRVPGKATGERHLLAR